MASAKLLVVTSFVACMVASSLAGTWGFFHPTFESRHFNQVPLPDGYAMIYNLPTFSIRNEFGSTLNAGTDKEELVRKGGYITYDPKYQLRAVVDYTADKNGFKAYYMFNQQEGFAKSPIVLKSLVG